MRSMCWIFEKDHYFQNFEILNSNLFQYTFFFILSLSFSLSLFTLWCWRQRQCNRKWSGKEGSDQVLCPIIKFVYFIRSWSSQVNSGYIRSCCCSRLHIFRQWRLESVTFQMSLIFGKVCLAGLTNCCFYLFSTYFPLNVCFIVSSTFNHHHHHKFFLHRYLTFVSIRVLRSLSVRQYGRQYLPTLKCSLRRVAFVSIMRASLDAHPYRPIIFQAQVFKSYTLAWSSLQKDNAHPPTFSFICLLWTVFLLLGRFFHLLFVSSFLLHKPEVAMGGVSNFV